MIHPEIKLVVGLGNPGSEYKNTRHNIGFMVLDKLAESESINFQANKKLFGYTTQIIKKDKTIRLLKPVTYMNDSGRAIRSTLDWFSIETHEILVLVDDMDLPLGKLRLRSQGGSGGHNGLKSIIQHLGTQEFSRLRIGIGPPTFIQEQRKSKTSSHVLGTFSSQEKIKVKDIIYEVKEGLELLHDFGWEKASNQINSYKS
mgnify:CR=1 FL=1